MIQTRYCSRRAALCVRLEDRLHWRDFRDSVAPVVKRLRTEHEAIAVLVLDVTDFAGWQGEAALAAQTNFLRRHRHLVRRVALLGAPSWRVAVPFLQRLFHRAEVRHFHACRRPPPE